MRGHTPKRSRARRLLKLAAVRFALLLGGGGRSKVGWGWQVESVSAAFTDMYQRQSKDIYKTANNFVTIIKQQRAMGKTRRLAAGSLRKPVKQAVATHFH